MKNNIKYIIVIVLFIGLIASITLFYLHVHYKDFGEMKINKKYYDIMFTNTVINDSDVSIKIDNDKDYIHIEIPKFNTKTMEFYLDVKNIGNLSAEVDSLSYTNIDTNMNKDNIKITSTINKNDVIKGSEDKKLIIKIENNDNISDNSYYNFNVNFVFKEVGI